MKLFLCLYLCERACACVRVNKKQKRLSALYALFFLPPSRLPLPLFPCPSLRYLLLSHTGMLEVADVMEKALQVLSLLASLVQKYKYLHLWRCVPGSTRGKARQKRRFEDTF